MDVYTCTINMLPNSMREVADLPHSKGSHHLAPSGLPGESHWDVSLRTWRAGPVATPGPVGLWSRRAQHPSHIPFTVQRSAQAAWASPLSHLLFTFQNETNKQSNLLHSLIVCKCKVSGGVLGHLYRILKNKHALNQVLRSSPWKSRVWTKIPVHWPATMLFIKEEDSNKKRYSKID